MMKPILSPSLRVLLSVVLLLTVPRTWAAQRADGPASGVSIVDNQDKVIKLTHRKNGKVNYIRVGDEIRYTTRDSTAGRRGIITSIQDDKIILSTQIPGTPNRMSMVLAPKELETVKKMGGAPEKLWLKILLGLVGLIATFSLLIVAFAGGLGWAFFAGLFIGAAFLTFPWFLFRKVRKIGRKYSLEIE